MLARTDPLWRIDPDGNLVFDPKPSQKLFIESPAEELLFSGPWGNGKTVALVVKLWMFAEMYPGAQLALIRKIYADLRLSTLRHFRRVLGDQRYFAGLVGGERPERFDFPNGSSVDFIGIAGEHSRTDRLMGTEYAFIGADECTELSEGEWEVARGRLRQPGVPIHQICGACNPGSPQHFLYRRFEPDMGSNRKYRADECRTCHGVGKVITPVLDDETGEVTEEPWECDRCRGTAKLQVLERECIVAGITENEENHPPSYVAMKRNLRGTRRARFYEGKWVAFEGQVFQTWDPNVHLCEAAQAPAGATPEQAARFLPPEWAPWNNLPPPDWPRVVGIDLGYENPFVAEWFAISPEGHWWRYREIYMSQRTVDLHGAQILAMDAAELEALRAAAKAADARLAEPHFQRDYADHLLQLNIALRPCDHDRGERELLGKAGVWTSRSDKDIAAGLQTIMGMMDPDAEGRVHLHVVRGVVAERDTALEQAGRPTCLEEEIPLYRWAKRVSGDLAGVAKDLPVDKDNHAIDAMRYALHTYAGGSGVAVY